MTTWIKGDNGNRASVEFWGSEQAARDSMKTLKGCSDCSDCSGCSDCSDCSGCSRCSRCSGCSDCSDCSRCSRCSRCSGCSGCSVYFRCSDCSRCSGCSDCSDCSGLAPQKIEQPAIPVIQDIHKAVYAAASQPEALEMKAWHSCDTTHCRAGWVIHLAGKAGYELEQRT